LFKVVEKDNSFSLAFLPGNNQKKRAKERKKKKCLSFK